MEYRWGDFRLDRHGTLLTRHGQQVDVTRKALDCMVYLIERRHSVVCYDELIRLLWGHDNVTNHQLAQVILSARRAIGDDGQMQQRVIRTIPGLGYRWMGAVSQGPDLTVVNTFQEQVPDVALAKQENPEAPPLENDDSVVTPSNDDLAVSVPKDKASFREQALEVVSAVQNKPAAQPLKEDAAEAPPPNNLAAPAPMNKASAPSKLKIKKLNAVIAFGFMMTMAAALGSYFLVTRSATSTGESLNSTTESPLAPLEDAFWQGDFEKVRNGLATLPKEQVDSPNGRILEIRLDIERGYFDRAAAKLALQQTRSESTGDTLWQAKLLTLKSALALREQKLASDILPPAEQAIALLESLGNRAPPSEMSAALTARSWGFMLDHQFELATKDLVRALDIVQKVGDMRRIAEVKTQFASVWLSAGRLTEALAQYNESAAIFMDLRLLPREFHARNFGSRIQIELIQWDEAVANSQRNIDLSQSLPDHVRPIAARRLNALALTNIGRLREAASMLEAADSTLYEKNASVGSTMYYLASGNPRKALDDAGVMFGYYNATDKSNPILQSQEGALLLWMMAAQDLVDAGNAMPTPSTAQLEVLQRPETTTGHIARGRWLWSKGLRREAESELRQAFNEARQMGRLFYMTLAAEPLVCLLLENNDVDAADVVLSTLRGTNPDRMDRDYRVGLLRLRIAVAKGDIIAIEEANREALALAGERALPKNILKMRVINYPSREKLSAFRD